MEGELELFNSFCAKVVEATTETDNQKRGQAHEDLMQLEQLLKAKNVIAFVFKALMSEEIVNNCKFSSKIE